MSQARVSRLYIYPIKSCGGVRLDGSELSETGLLFDRRYMLVSKRFDETGRVSYKPLTMRTHPRMGLIRVTLGPHGPCQDQVYANVSFDKQAQSIQIPLDPKADQLREWKLTTSTVKLWSWELYGLDTGPEYSLFFQHALGVSCTLLYMAPYTRYLRGNAPPRDAGIARNPTVGFADGFPFLLASESSLGTINEQLESQGKNPVPIERFRPNIVIQGSLPFAEEEWTIVNIGQHEFALCSRCPRCTVPNVDITTGLKSRAREPFKTVQMFHSPDPGAPNKPIFGMNAVCSSTTGFVRVGDQLQVQQYGQHHYLPS